MIKNLPVVQELQEMRLRSLSQGDPLEEEMATHSSILAWEIPWTKEPGGVVHGIAESDMTEAIGHAHLGILFTARRADL